MTAVLTSHTNPTKEVKGKAAYLEATKRFYSTIRRVELQQILVDGTRAVALTRYKIQQPDKPEFTSDVAEAFSVKGDTTQESDELFFLNLFSQTGNAFISDSQGVGTIRNDDSTSSSKVGVITDQTDSTKTELRIFGTKNNDVIDISQVGAEETEWHRRFYEHGWKVVFFADASVIHYGSQTVAENNGALYPEYLKGVLNYFRLHRPAATVAFFCAALFSMYSARLASARIRGDTSDAEIARQYLRVVRNAMTLPRSAP